MRELPLSLRQPARKPSRPRKRGKALPESVQAASAVGTWFLLGGVASLGAAVLASLFKYHGFKSTRFVIAVGLSALSTLVWLFGCAAGASGCIVTAGMTTDQWTNFQLWLFGTYATAETVVKSADAVRAAKELQ